MQGRVRQAGPSVLEPDSGLWELCLSVTRPPVPRERQSPFLGVSVVPLPPSFASSSSCETTAGLGEQVYTLTQITSWSDKKTTTSKSEFAAA